MTEHKGYQPLRARLLAMPAATARPTMTQTIDRCCIKDTILYRRRKLRSARATGTARSTTVLPERPQLCTTPNAAKKEGAAQMRSPKHQPRPPGGNPKRPQTQDSVRRRWWAGAATSPPPGTIDPEVAYKLLAERPREATHCELRSCGTTASKLHNTSVPRAEFRPKLSRFFFCVTKARSTR